MKKSTYLKLGILALVVLLIYGMCSTIVEQMKFANNMRMSEGTYHYDSLKRFDSQLYKDSIIKILGLANEGFNSYEVTVPCRDTTMTVYYTLAFDSIQNREVFELDFLSGGIRATNEEEYYKLRKIYLECYESQILSKLK